VGGTTLTLDANNQLISETGWSSGGGGCSAYESPSSAQAAFSQYSAVKCAGMRATPDVSLDADPNSGVSVYDSTPYNGQSGWFTVGGTSASTPMWAAASADANVLMNSDYVYANNISFRDITSGNNGASCLVGYDLCSGRGSWIFSTSASTTTSPTTSSTSSTTTSSTVPSSGSMSVTMSVGTIAQKGPNYKVPLGVTVTDSRSTQGISGASVSLSVYSGLITSSGSCSGSPVATGTGTTSSSGSVTFTFSTKSHGNWCAIASATAAGYASATSGAAQFST
ncbi:MAG TPA: hypothetical protein VFN54_06130, partial [Acidimicrobiales bacterium]|nr:hypothetical protein [Acidimicrobiales bacterium]